MKSKDGACLKYYTENLRFDHVSGGLLFRLPNKILYHLKYFGLYTFALRIETDTVLTALPYK